MCYKAAGVKDLKDPRKWRKDGVGKEYDYRDTSASKSLI